MATMLVSYMRVSKSDGTRAPENRTREPPACKSPTTNRVDLHHARTEVPERPRLPIVGPCYWHDGGTGRGYSPSPCGLFVPKPRGCRDRRLQVTQGFRCPRVGGLSPKGSSSGRPQVSNGCGGSAVSY